MRQVVEQLGPVTGPATGQLGPGQVGAALGHPADVGHRVVERLQLPAPGLDHIEIETRGVVAPGHPAPPDTGGSTATSSAAPTTVASPAGSPLTHTLHVASTSANAGP